MVSFKLKFRPRTSLFSYMESQVTKLRGHGQYRTAETYNSTLNSFRYFRKDSDLSLKELSNELLADYAFYLKNRGVSPNTVAFYLKRLRAIYNKAVEEELVENRHPFREISTSSEKTAKRAISLKYIRQLKELDLTHSPSKCFARDMFLFSFYTRGMSFIDMANLQKADLCSDILSYRRKKTGQQLSIHWEPCMKQIAERYQTPPTSPYLLAILRPTDGDPRKQYHSVLTLINRHLKEIGRSIGLSIPLTMYVARHSWASIARNEGIPLSVISEGMGHESERTTRIYLASLEPQIINNANKKILQKLS